MKILHLTKKYPNALGGDAVVVANLEKQHKQAGHSVTVLTSRCDDIPSRPHIYTFGFKSTAAELDTLNVKRILSLGMLFFKAFKILRKERPDVIHSHSIDMACALSIAARLYRIPIVHTFHILTFNNAQHGGSFRSRIELYLLKATRPKTITVLNPDDVKDLQNEGFSNVSYIPNGVDVDFWSPGKDIVKNDIFTFIAVGRLEDQKGFIHLIDAAEQLNRKGLTFRLAIVGEGSLREALQLEIDSRNLQDVVTLLGRKDSSELRDLYRQANAYVLSSLWEGMPLTLLEAWACGLPSISTTVSGVATFAGDAAVLVQPGDSEALSEAMEQVYGDKSRRANLAAAAERKARSMSWRQIAISLEALYGPSKPRVAIYFDTLVTMGGAEKVVVQLANELGADIITSGYDPEKLIVKPKYAVHDLGNTTLKLFKPIGYLFEAPLRFYFCRNKFDYDTEIFIGFTSIFGVRKNRNSIQYCLTPNRIIYDLRQQKLASQPLLGKIALWAHILLFGAWDKRSVGRFAKIVCQTKNVQARIKKYYHRDAAVLYAPVDTSRYQRGAIGDYFLAVSRLFPEKRMALIAEAFIGTQQKLIVVGDGPEREKIQKIAAGNPNIQLKSDLSEDQLIALYTGCRATIYMPVDEDYGLVPIEGMAAGKPCIAVDEGGCRETVVEGVTGLLIKPTTDAIQSAVGIVTADWARARQQKCVDHAASFDIKVFIAKWKQLV